MGFPVSISRIHTAYIGEASSILGTNEMFGDKWDDPSSNHLQSRHCQLSSLKCLGGFCLKKKSRIPRCAECMGNIYIYRWLIGILIMVYEDSHIRGSYNPLYTLNNQVSWSHDFWHESPLAQLGPGSQGQPEKHL